MLSFSSGPLVLGAMRRQLPTSTGPSGCPAATSSRCWLRASNLIVFWAGWKTNYKLLIAILIGYVLLAAYHRFSADAAPLEWRAGAWIAPWLIGLMVISYLGDYGDGRDVLTLGWGSLAVSVLSCGVYALAMRLRLPRERVIESIEHAPRE